MASSQSTGTTTLSGVEGAGAPEGRATAQSGRSTLVPPDEHARPSASQATPAAQDYSNFTAAARNQVAPQVRSSRIWKSKNKKKDPATSSSPVI